MKGKGERPIDYIERRTRKKVAIDAFETDETLSKCHPQNECPLFSVLPREIRFEIWRFVTAPYEDPDHKYAENEYYYRPGHTARLKTDTKLLLTCRRIWLEANRFPMLQAEHCFWYYRAAPDARDKDWMAQLTPFNRQNFGELHLFAQMYAIERLRSDHLGQLRQFFLHRTLVYPSDFQPRMFHVTIRHTDWWNWEEEWPLRFEDHWLQAMLNTPDLRSTHTLKLDLETLDYKVPQILPIVERLERLPSREFETHIVDGRQETTKFVLQTKREESAWSGPPNIDNSNFDPYKGKDKLNYHIITLTWKLQFPQLPAAHIPALRLAPRVQSFQPDSYNSVWDHRPSTRLWNHPSSTRSSEGHLANRSPNTNPRHSYFQASQPHRSSLRPGAHERWTAWLHKRGIGFLDAGLKLRMVSVSQAEQTEQLRWVAFNKMMEPFWTKIHSDPWTRKDENGRSTLLSWAD